MKIAILGDAHLIADDDPYTYLHRERSFFLGTGKSFRALLQEVNRESPDVTIFLGDLVDWFSHENIRFGLDLLTTLSSPLYMVPGNHDLEAPDGDFGLKHYSVRASRKNIRYWQSQGVDLAHRKLDLGDMSVLLVDNALSDNYKNVDSWLEQALIKNDKNLLFSHVPIDTPQMRNYIHSVDSRRDLRKYVMSGAPELYPQTLKDRISFMFSAHLHFGGHLQCHSTQVHLCSMSTSISKHGEGQARTAEATIIQGTKGDLRVRRIEAASM
jgi:predicted MPP superfamily phosphohydrolase